jgi:subtilisin-like proprotein convertase family protein
MLILLCLLCGAGAWFLWHHGRSAAQKQVIAPSAVVTGPASVTPTASRPGVINTNAAQISLAEWNTNRFAGRLSNTTQPLEQLLHDDRAILLENALIDTRQPASFVFPKNLQPPGDPGAYIVQAHGPIDNAFRALLAQAGATVVSYIPNDAYLVRASAGVAGALESSPLTQAVIPYEPYYKIQSSLLYQAVAQMVLPDGTPLNLGLFPDAAPATISQITKLGGQVIGQDQSPFGPVVRVIPPRNWTALAVLPGVQIVESFYQRAPANDLARATNGVAANSLVPTNYMNLTGSNIIVEVNDTGIDAQHPDFSGGGPIRVIGDAPQSLVDTNGHGTHVAGIIAGDGTESPTVTNAPGSTLVGGTGLPGQFRGMAPGATLYSVGGIEGGADTNIITDQYFQEVPALTNALISNNSWVYEGNSGYDLAAASYDAAVRDALPMVTGSQPVLFVFAAGNDGNGSDSSDFGGGTPDSIDSPATAKNVITVGAIQEDRNITNTVTNAEGQISAPWQPETSTSYRVAGFSSRGNVGIGTEGTFGRYKPDVVAPGTFIISTRSEQWDINSYFYQNPTNDQSQTFSGFTVQPGSIVSRPFPFIPSNSVQLVITTYPNANSPFSFAVLPTLMGLFTSPGYQFISTNDPVYIPPDPGAPTIQQILNSGQGFTGAFNFAISNNTSSQVIFDLRTDIFTTNGTGNYFLVLSNLDNSIGTPNSSSTGPGPYYRYETGTSMSTPMVSGMLALLQQFYVNAYGANPSPAMLKAMVVNGARATGFYDFNSQNSINYEGWGLINLPNSLPPGMTNHLSAACSDFIQDQNPTNALATGDSQTFFVTTTNAQPLRVTLAWTDPPGDPAAAIKLVNNLVLVVTNLSNPTNPVVYYGNDIPASSTFNSARNTNTPPVIDFINNVQNVYLPTGAGTSFSVTVLGYRVNVNAVTAQTNNVVQDYALVISCGNGQLPSVMTVATTPASYVSNPTGDQDITVLAATNSNTPLLNQFVGASSPLLGTNTIPFTVTAPEAFGTNWQVTVGQTNQWHFYVVTNTFGANFTNAAFITFIPDTLSIPRMGVFAGSVANATRPEADIDLYVSTDPSLTNLNPAAISNAVVGTQVGATTAGPTFMGASLSRGGTEFVVDTNSQPNQVYYVGVKSEDQMASEYGFISIFSETPFSQMSGGNQVVNGVPVPFNIPDGSPAHPGSAYIFGLAIYPMTVGLVTVGDTIQHQNFGDLIGTLTLDGSHPDVLNNHDSLHNGTGVYINNYDDSGSGSIPGSRPSDGPGSLNNFAGQQGVGVWILTEVDDSLTQTGAVQNFNLTIQPHQDLTGDVPFSILPNSWFYDYIDVPLGATYLTVTVTNYPPAANPPLELFVKLGALPTTNSFDGSALINTPGPAGPWGSVSLGPPLTSGRYWVGIFNPSTTVANGVVFANIGLGVAPGETIYSSSGLVPILDDAVTTNNITVPDNNIISSLEVALRVQHPRVSDLVFHLIGPDGTRDLLVENRGGTDPNGMGATLTASNGVVQPQNFSGGAETSTNVINTGQNSGTLSISYNFFTLPDELAVYDGGAPIFHSGLVSGSGVFNIPYTGTSSQLSIVMNPFGNPGGPGDAWTFTLNSVGPAYAYLVLTEDTNKTTTPIKFAVPPFGGAGANAVAWENGFEESTVQFTPTAGQYFSGGWLVDYGNIDVLSSPYTPYTGNWLIDLDGNTAGGISTNIPTVPGQFYTLSFAYTRSPANVGLGLNVPQAQVLINGTVLGVVAPGYTNSSANYNWQTTSFVYKATTTLTHLAFHSLDPSGYVAGVYLDAITNTPGGDLYYLPEQSLADAYDGLNAGGQWTLEIQDDRAGATNPAPMLLSWQLRFNYVTTGTSPNGTPPGTTVTNIIPPGSIAYYPVNVPTNADAATNILIFANGPLNMWFNPTNDPVGANPPDYLLLGGSTNGSSTLSTFSVPTNIVPGSVYYIGLQNTNTFPVTNGFEVNFHFYPTPISLTNGVPVTGTISGTISGDGMAYYSVTVPPDADYATNLLLSSTQPVNVWFNQNKVPVGLSPPDSLLISNATNGVSILSAGSTPPLVPGATYYLAVQNTNGPSATFALEVNFHLYTPLTNGVPATNTVSSNSFAYYTVTVPTNADYATNRLLFASLPVNVWFNQYVPPTGLYPTDFLLISNATNGTSILSASTTPPLVPGATYYLGVQNTNSVPVNFGLEVDFHLVIPPSISGLTITPTNNGVTNGFLLQWSGPTNYQYTIQWATNLAPPTAWNTVLNPVINLVVTPTNGNYSWFDDGSLAGGFPPVKFYRVLGSLISAPITNSTPVTNIVVAGTFTPLMVNVPANAIAASNILVSATGPLNVWFNQITPPTTSTNAGNVLMLSNVTSGSFLLTSNSVPPLVPGASYYLGLQNTGTTNVSFVFEVNFAYAAVTSNAPTISSITLTNMGTTNGILLTWFAPTNYQFQVQWTTSLSPASWTTIPGVILTNLASFTPTNGVGEFQYFDNGSMTGGFGLVKFYRLIAYAPGATIPPDLIISSVLASPGSLQFQWNGLTNYTYDVLWTTNLALPVGSWNIISNLASPTLTYSSGIFTYTDTNTLTAGSAEFFRVLLLP